MVSWLKVHPYILSVVVGKISHTRTDRHPIWFRVMGSDSTRRVRFNKGFVGRFLCCSNDLCRHSRDGSRRDITKFFNPPNRPLVRHALRSDGSSWWRGIVLGCLSGGLANDFAMLKARDLSICKPLLLCVLMRDALRPAPVKKIEQLLGSDRLALRKIIPTTIPCQNRLHCMCPRYRRTRSRTLFPRWLRDLGAKRHLGIKRRVHYAVSVRYIHELRHDVSFLTLIQTKPRAICFASCTLELLQECPNLLTRLHRLERTQYSGSSVRPVLPIDGVEYQTETMARRAV